MHLVTPLSVGSISMVILLSSLAIFSVLGNGFVLGIVARFKKLRTYPNILIANVALVDLLNALINMPIYLLYGVLEVSWFKGKTLAILSLFLSGLFTFLNVVSMLVILVNVFLAITFELRYFVWKTKAKAIAIVLAEWLVSITFVSLSCLPRFDIDLQDTHYVLEYLQVVYKTNRTFMLATAAVFIGSSLRFGALIFCAVRKKQMQVRELAKTIMEFM